MVKGLLMEQVLPAIYRSLYNYNRQIPRRQKKK